MLPTELLAQRWKLSVPLEGIHSAGCDAAHHGPEPRGRSWVHLRARETGLVWGWGRLIWGIVGKGRIAESKWPQLR